MINDPVTTDSKQLPSLQLVLYHLHYQSDFALP